MNKKEIFAYNFDASQEEGQIIGVFLPKNIEETQKFIRESKYITIKGGGTGLAGGSVPQKDFVLDLSKLNRITDLDKEKKSVVVEAGVILDELEEYLERFNFEFPVNPSSHSVCTIGGMAATNAVGTRAIKYGRMIDWIKWLDIIDHRGELKRIPKTDLKDYCGMEGLTGVIVRACLNLIEKKKRYKEIFYFDNYEEIPKKVLELKKREKICAIEFLDKRISKMVGLDGFYSLIAEFEDEVVDKEKIEQSKKISLARDSVFPKLASEGYYIIEDPKLMIEKSSFLLEWCEKKEIPVYGHISVGIFHPCFSKEKKHLIKEMMILIKKNGGQITGEHGIGLLKKEFVEMNDKKIFQSIKRRLDPRNKFNRNKII